MILPIRFSFLVADVLSREVSIGGASNGTLEIRNASKGDGGIYRCKAANGLGEDIEKQVTVKVIGIVK